MTRLASGRSGLGYTPPEPPHHRLLLHPGQLSLFLEGRSIKRATAVKAKRLRLIDPFETEVNQPIIVVLSVTHLRVIDGCSCVTCI